MSLRTKSTMSSSATSKRRDPSRKSASLTTKEHNASIDHQTITKHNTTMETSSLSTKYKPTTGNSSATTKQNSWLTEISSAKPDRHNRSMVSPITTHLDPYEVKPCHVDTAVLLLDSTEPEVIWKTLRALTKFAQQDSINRQRLFESDVLKHMLRHIHNKDIVVKRYALKLLAEMAQLPGGPEQILKDPQNIKQLSYFMAKMEDVYILDAATLCMSILTKEKEGVAQFFNANIWKSLFSRMKNSEDPDIQNNCLQILNNVLEDQACAAKVIKNSQFSWSSILSQLQNKYQEIQRNVLNIIKNIVTRFDDYAAQNTFRHSTGIEDLLDILNIYQFRDIHIQTLNVIGAYVETKDNIIHLHEKDGVARLVSYLDMALPVMKPHAVAVLAKLSVHPWGREVLYETEVDLVFCKYLSGMNEDCLADAATGVANMTILLPSAIRMADTNVVETLCGILEDESIDWYYIRINCLKVLSDLCQKIPKAACKLVEPKTFDVLKHMIDVNHDNVPIEAQRQVMQCCLNLQNYHVAYNAMLNLEFIDQLVKILLKRFDIKMKFFTCQVLKGLMAEEYCKEYFMTCNGAQAVHDNLRIDHIGFRTALCDLITASVTDETADTFLELGTVHFMVENHKVRYRVSSWETALNEIFRYAPSAKFAYTGRLEINDITRDGFYVMKKLQSPFPCLSELMSTLPPFEHPVYICKFQQPASERNSSIDIRTPYELIVPDIAIEDPMPTSEAIDEERPLAPAPSSNFVPDFIDFNLRKYLEKMILAFGESSRDKCHEVSTALKQKAQVLAEFVADRMNCETQIDCGVLTMELHLAQLMRKRNSLVLGIGDICCGQSLERSVMFKVLADRLGIPCSLQRVRGHTWCEIAVPERSASETDKAAVYPAVLLRANYVVDLTFTPGRLMVKGSFEAKRYCGPSRPYYTAKA